MWRDLQQLKSFRERQARTTLLARQAELALAHRSQAAAADALQAHRRLAEQHERSLYADLMRRRVRLRDIEQVQQAVAHLGRVEQGLAQREQDAARRAEQQSQLTDQASQQHRVAERVQEKFDQLARQHDDEAARLAERAEDLELEEVASLRREREDWDGLDEGAA